MPTESAQPAQAPRGSEGSSVPARRGAVGPPPGAQGLQMLLAPLLLTLLLTLLGSASACSHWTFVWPAAAFVLTSTPAIFYGAWGYAR